LDTTTPPLASIGIDIGEEVCHIVGFGADGKIGPPTEAAFHMTANARAAPKTISVFTPAIMMPR
jgi:hypothetical protein